MKPDRLTADKFAVGIRNLHHTPACGAEIVLPLLSLQIHVINTNFRPVADLEGVQLHAGAPSKLLPRDSHDLLNFAKIVFHGPFGTGFTCRCDRVLTALLGTNLSSRALRNTFPFYCIQNVYSLSQCKIHEYKGNWDSR